MGFLRRLNGDLKSSKFHFRETVGTPDEMPKASTPAYQWMMPVRSPNPRPGAMGDTSYAIKRGLSSTQSRLFRLQGVIVLA